jgi:TrmH family RNA methyltransferase
LETIRSAAHPLVKRLRAAAAGRQIGVILLEGDRLVDEAQRRQLALEVVLVSDRRADRAAELLEAGLPVRVVLDAVLAAASPLKSPPGCLALAPEPPLHALAELALDEDALVAAVAGVQDPGNLGALARTAEAAGAGALVVIGGSCSPWNPKALRGSMGSLLRLPVVRHDSAAAALRALEALGFRSVVARARGGASHETFDWTGRVALWLSAETGELPAEVDRALAGVSISMAGDVESLNVTAAAAILLFAARRAAVRT